MKLLRLSLQMVLREWRAGELHVLLLAVVIAVAGLASVNAFTVRMHLGLNQESNRLLGADMVLASDHPIAPALITRIPHSLVTAQTTQFPSMISHGQDINLAEIMAVTNGYPLRGRLRISAGLFNADHPVRLIPARGTVWLEPRLADTLHVSTGDFIQLGYARFKIAAILTSEPDRGGDFFNLAPRLLMNQVDLPVTGLITPASRASYQLLIAGDADRVAVYHTALTHQLERGQKIVTVADARPQIRDVLVKAERYLGLSILLAVMLAAVAILLAVRHFVRRHLDACALLRCFGASQSTIVTIYSLQILGLGVLAALVGMVIGFLGQAVLAGILGRLAGLTLPAATLLPFVQAALAGLTLMAGFSLPSLLALRRVSALRILRRDAIALNAYSGIAYLLGVAVLTGLLLWQVREVKLTLLVLSGLALTLPITALCAWGLVRLAGWLGTRSHGSWRQGLLNLRRRNVGSIIQISAFTLGILALLLLTVVRGDLLTYWRNTLPADAPNRFVIDIQPQQRLALLAFLQQHGLTGIKLYPMIRGRLVAINDHEVNSANYKDQQTQQLVDREFNLSYVSHFDRVDGDNRFVVGKGWNQDGAAAQFSVEQGIAEKLGLKVGDKLAFEVGGSKVVAPITSLRKVKWDSFKVNFFVIANSGLLQDMPASYITSFYLPAAKIDTLNQMVKTYPNLTVIDVSAIMQSIQQMLSRVIAAVQFVFVFSLASGLVVLYTGLVTTRDERAMETALWRVFGARRQQLWLAQLTEFGAIGLLSGMLAASGASAIGWKLSSTVFGIAYHFEPRLWLAAMVLGCAGVIAVGMSGLWGISRLPPLVTLRDAPV